MLQLLFPLFTSETLQIHFQKGCKISYNILEYNANALRNFVSVKLI